MIVDRRIIFFSSEASDYARELIYQEYFSEQKEGFVLPEIVEQMEKAQDKIIRSHHFGSFLIAGAAGSGKTTLALHRVAYLVQSPQTATLFAPNDIIVFVQDSSTKEYFSGLLPELGIYRVKIVTFDEWALRTLGIRDMQFVKRFGETEDEKDAYEYSKYKALKTSENPSKAKNITKIIEETYDSFLSREQKATLTLQLQNNMLDRFDLTILLKNHSHINGELVETVEKYIKQKSTGKYIKKSVKLPAQYSLIVLDEAENYLSEQIEMIKACIDPKTNALMYVGDLAQQTHLWTIRDWHDVGEQFEEERHIVLHKIYRNTKQILAFIQSVGYSIEIPANLREGKEVIQNVSTSRADELRFVSQIVEKNQESSIGILAKTEEYLNEYKKKFQEQKNVHVLTINEAQGVEFEAVFLIGLNREFYATNDLSDEIAKERKRVNRDLLYVALTRAMRELYISGNTTINKLLD